MATDVVRVKARPFGPEWEGWKRKFLVEGQRHGLQKAAEHWHKEFRLRHFEGYAPHKYGYKRRSAGYERRRKGRGALTYSGELKRGTETATYKVWGKRALLTMPYPEYARMDRRAKLTDAEMRQFAEVNHEYWSKMPDALLMHMRKRGKKESAAVAAARLEFLNVHGVPTTPDDFLRLLIAEKQAGGVERRGRRWYSYPDIKSELTRTTADEAKELGGVLKVEMTGFLERYRDVARFKSAR